MSGDPRLTLAQAPMRALQVTVIGLCIALSAIDGFDVLAISLSAPGIANEWGIDRVTLGVVLSMELIGMAVGSVLIGNIADRVGRRPTVLACVTIMSAGMFLAAHATGVQMLSLTRLFTGLGIGGMLSCTSATVAEFSNERRRGLTMALNISGYTLGATVGGLIASFLLGATGDWRSVFLLGGFATAGLIPLCWALLPESIDFLVARQPRAALERVNATLVRLGHAPVISLPKPAARSERPSITLLFSARLAPLTIVLTIAYFAQVMVFYYLVKWIPKIVVDMGFEASTAGHVLVCANIGAFLGAISVGLASQFFPLRAALIVSMLVGFVAIGVFGLGHRDLVQLSIVAGVAGFFINFGGVGLFPILGETFPASLRASGIGFVIGVGRGSSALGPIIAGGLFAMGNTLLTVSLVMGGGALVAAAMLALLPYAEAIGQRAERAP